MAQILTDLTVYKRLYATPNHELWEKGRQHQIDLIAALRCGDGERAREVMLSHMEMARDLMEAQQAEVLKRFIAE
jgi:DNA-binding GntR family transcriptional regulator